MFNSDLGLAIGGSRFLLRRAAEVTNANHSRYRSLTPTSVQPIHAAPTFRETTFKSLRSTGHFLSVMLETAAAGQPDPFRTRPAVQFWS